MKKIKLYGKYGNGRYTLVSDCDYDFLSKYKWMIAKDHNNPTLLYVVRSVGDSKIFMHRVILGDKNGYVGDHINRNTLDNRRSNLRHAIPKESNINRSRDLNSFRYATKLKSGKWQSQVNIGGNTIYLGTSDTLEDANKKSLKFMYRRRV